MFEIISLDLKSRWNEIIRSMDQYDFYHLADYHRLDHSGTPLLLHFSTKNADLSLPVILRSIEGTEYMDITSVYGYAGPLSARETVDIQSVEAFQKELLHFFDSYRVVSAFARLHPLFKGQKELLTGLGEVIDTNLTVGIDLALPENEQRKHYSRSLKYKINSLKKKGVTIVAASTAKEVDVFRAIYKENMDRVHASERYFFSSDYFYTILNEIDSCILLAFYKDEFISGSLCTFCNGIVQAHLNATRDDFLYLSPLKLVLEQARIEGIKRKMQWLHLGGGRSGADDSLFVFKSRFSDLRFPFKTWKYIHNKSIYAQLISTKFSSDIPQSSFFPLYRIEENGVNPY
jgi:hypothetical protein